jgi:methyl-accepting chemotaxis protein
MAVTGTSDRPTLRWTISRKIYLVLAGIALGLLTIGVVSYTAVGTLSDNAALVEHTHRVLEQAEAVDASLTEAETGQYGFLVTGQDQYLERYRQAGTELAKEQQELRALTADNAGQQQRLDQLGPLIEARMAEMQETMTLRSGPGGFEAAQQVVLTAKGKAVMDQIRTLLDALAGDERNLLATRSEAAASSRTMARTVIVLGSGLLLLAMAVAGTVLARRIGRPVNEVTAALRRLQDGDLTVAVPLTTTDELAVMAVSLNAASTRLRDSIGVIDTSANTLAAAVGELGSTTADMTRSAGNVSSKMIDASAASRQVSGNVQSIAAGAEEMGASIREISRSTSEAAAIAHRAVDVAASTNERVASLGDSSRQIGDVIKVITAIAEQTNLLALNATIEAARAGESGKGFAVVASEVKELAQETAKATEDISRRVQAIQSDTTGAVEAISEISNVIAQISDYQSTIAAAVEQQTATTAEMSRSVADAAETSRGIADSADDMVDDTRRTTSAVEASQATVTQVAELSTRLREVVSRFTV